MFDSRSCNRLVTDLKKLSCIVGDDACGTGRGPFVLFLVVLVDSCAGLLTVGDANGDDTVSSGEGTLMVDGSTDSDETAGEVVSSGAESCDMDFGGDGPGVVVSGATAADDEELMTDSTPSAPTVQCPRLSGFALMLLLCISEMGEKAIGHTEELGGGKNDRLPNAQQSSLLRL